jgi:uncharacterized membrane protein
MNRFLIFLFVFPAIATASFYAVVYILTGAELDSFSGPAICYLMFAGPGLVVALADWFFARTRLPVLIATTLFAYAASVLIVALDIARTGDLLVLGLIGAIPAAVCSWLSNTPRKLR